MFSVHYTSAPRTHKKQGDSPVPSSIDSTWKNTGIEEFVNNKKTDLLGKTI
jgi:hypothetical protein